MEKSAVVIIPTIGNDNLYFALESVSNQTYKNVIAYVVVDGDQYKEAVETLLKYNPTLPNVKIAYLSENVGANGFYGHRIYAAFSNLINQDYVFFLDEDNWLEPNHIESMISKLEETDSQWVYSLRNICSNDGFDVIPDNCESLGKWKAWTNCNHIDTSCYCLRKEIAIAISTAWYGGWGQDRIVYNTLNQYFPHYECTGKYTLNYRLGGNDGSVKKDFFEHGNIIMNEKYQGKFPWSENNE